MPVVDASPAAARRARATMRSAVSAVVRTTSAERAGAGAGAAPSAARIRSFSAGSRTVIRNAVRNAADDEALRLELVGARRRRGRRRSSRRTAGSRSRRRAAPSRIRSRSAIVSLDVEPRVAQRGGGDPRRRARRRAPGRGGGRARARPRARRPRSRRAAPRGRTPSTACGSRSGSASRRSAGRPSSRRTRSTPRRRRPPRPGATRASAAISSGSTSSPVGLFGLQTQTRSAPAGSSVELGALDPGGDRVERVGRLLARTRAGPARGTSARRARSARRRRHRGRSAPARPRRRRPPPRAARGTCPRGTRSAARSSRRAAPAARPGSGGTFCVEADDLGRVQPVPARAISLERSRPRRTARTASGQRPALTSPRPPLPRRGAGRPSSSARVSTVSRTAASASRVARTNCTGFRNASRPRPPVPRARPPVGRTWFEPAA